MSDEEYFLCQQYLIEEQKVFIKEECKITI
jgi:hypothetical protein